MEKLYSLAIDGRMFYFLGIIDESKFDQIDNIAKQIKVDTIDYESYCNNFIETIKTALGIKLQQINITYVFRK